MSEADIRYGWEVNKALEWMEPFHTIRFLRREHGVTYAYVVDEWIAARPESLSAFVERICAKKDIPPDFYRASASIEGSTSS